MTKISMIIVITIVIIVIAINTIIIIVVEKKKKKKKLGSTIEHFSSVFLDGKLLRIYVRSKFVLKTHSKCLYHILNLFLREISRKCYNQVNKKTFID